MRQGKAGLLVQQFLGQDVLGLLLRDFDEGVALGVLRSGYALVRDQVDQLVGIQSDRQ